MNNKYQYGTISFGAGFILMAYELVAARLLAPGLGTSMYVWTSVIGTMIAALALGYHLGGRLADNRHRTGDISWLLLLSAMTIVITATLTPLALDLITRNLVDPRLQGVTAALALFAATSIVLGMISPYLAKQSLQSLNNSGSTIATLGALNSLGGITGTFITGFIMFDLIGSRLTLVALAGIATTLSWCLNYRTDFLHRGVTTAGIIILTILYLSSIKSPDVVTEIDTNTAHYQITDINYHGIAARGIRTGPYGIQSGIAHDTPNDLLFTYTRDLARFSAIAPSHERILILGGGGFTLPEYLGRTYPNAKIDVVEIDPKLEYISAKYLDYETQSNVTSYAMDARRFIALADSASYDLIIVDVYSDASVPPSLTTIEYAQSLNRITAANGTILANVIGSTRDYCLPYVSSIHRTYTYVFKNSKYYPSTNPNPDTYQNFIAIYSRQPLDWTDQIEGTLNLDHSLNSGQTLTDDLAPSEKLMQSCFSQSLKAWH